jgi:hypothetical protein
LPPSHSSFWLGQWFLQMPQPIIVVITAIIAIAKFSSTSEKTRSLCRVFLFGCKVLPAG